MRVWHQKIISSLCQKHLCACWRESLGMIIILTENKDCPYRHHPATIEFEKCPDKLWDRMKLIREEMLKRGYHPKELPPRPQQTEFEPEEWEDLQTQIKKLKIKKATIKSCKCDI